MTEESLAKWVGEELVAQILQNDELRGAVLTQHEVRELDGMKDNWASSMYDVKLLLDHHGNKSLSLLLKVMNEDARVRDKLQSPRQFFNEIHFYSTVNSLFTSLVPTKHLKSDFEDLFPKCFYSYYNKNINLQSYRDASIVLENLKVRDFKLGNRTSLDFKHCALALRCLGEFHAFSYFVKERDPDRFMNEVVKPIEETNYDPKDRNNWNAVFGICEQRVIDGLVASGSDCELELKRLRDLAAKEAFDVFTDLVRPREPLSVLCHGDFLRNNVLFRYDNGEPVEMKLIDFQTIRYASPAIDISLLISMNTTHELRAAHLDELLHVYHTSLTNKLAALLGKPKDQLHPRYSFESFLADFRRHAVYGYLITVEFLAWMFADDDELEAFLKVFWEERGGPRHLELTYKLGGDKATRELIDLAKDFIERKYI